MDFKTRIKSALPAASVTVRVWIPDRPDLKRLRCYLTVFSPPKLSQTWKMSCVCRACMSHTNAHSQFGFRETCRLEIQAPCPISSHVFSPPVAISWSGLSTLLLFRVKIDLLLTHQYWPVSQFVFNAVFTQEIKLQLHARAAWPQNKYLSL